MAITDEQQLWCAVITNALDEALGGYIAGAQGLPAREHIIRQARQWLTRPNADFNEVCHLAGLNPQAVRERATRLIAEYDQQQGKPSDKSNTPRNGGRKETKTLTHNGETLLISEWAKRTGIGALTIKGRIGKGWSAERALTETVRNYRPKPGVGKNFAAFEGTGGGRHAQDISELEFSE